MFGFLKKLFADKKLNGLTQDQNEAFLEVLASVVIIDGGMDPSELEEVSASLELLDWQRSDVSAQAHFDAACASSASLCGADEATLRRHVQERAERLHEPWLREEAYYVSALIASADQNIDEAERTLLNLIVEEFGISRQRLESITQKIINQNTAF